MYRCIYNERKLSLKQEQKHHGILKKNQGFRGVTITEKKRMSKQKGCIAISGKKFHFC